MSKDKITKSPASKKEKKGIKEFLKSRKARHGSVAVAITAIVIALVIVLNIVVGLVMDRFPEAVLDLTSNSVFELQKDTADYISHLEKDVTVNILMGKDAFENQGSYFVQAQKLLEKMQSKSNGKLTIKYVDLTLNPSFTADYKDIDWNSTTNAYLALVVCGDQHKVLTLSDCFTYDESYLAYYGQYQFTETKIEQAVVTATLNVTTEDKVTVDMITSSNVQDFSGIKTLLENNAYNVEEKNLTTEELNNEAEVTFLFCPSVDLDENEVQKLSDWLDNNGEYGRTLVYVPPVEKTDTPNLDQFLEQWGMSVDKSYVFETSANRLISSQNLFAFIVDYTDYYKDTLKNANIPVVVHDAHSIEIKDENTAHALLVTSEGAGLEPEDTKDGWNPMDYVKGSAINVACEGEKSNSDGKSSRVSVFGSYVMFMSEILQYNSFNNSAYLVNMLNTVTDRGDSGITIESKQMNATELGVTDVATQDTMFWIFVIVLPVAIFAVGIVLWIRRRNR